MCQGDSKNFTDVFEQPLTREASKCGEFVKYDCTCSHYWKTAFCEHVLAVGLHEGTIEAPERTDGAKLTEKQDSGRPSTQHKKYYDRANVV